MCAICNLTQFNGKIYELTNRLDETNAKLQAMTEERNNLNAELTKEKEKVCLSG